MNGNAVWYVWPMLKENRVCILMQLFTFQKDTFDCFLLTGDPKESYYIGSVEDTSIVHLNQWPSEGMAFLCILTF